MRKQSAHEKKIEHDQEKDKERFCPPPGCRVTAHKTYADYYRYNFIDHVDPWEKNPFVPD